MGRFNLDKLTVELREGVTERAPMIPRRYSFTLSEDTQDMILTIGPEFVYDNVSTNRNDVLGEWLYLEDEFRFYIYLRIKEGNGQGIDGSYYEFRLWTLLLALEAIRYGDKQYFHLKPELDQYPIIVYFLYDNPRLNKAENWGTFSEYVQLTSIEQVMANSIMEHRVLIDEKIGDLNGDGLPDRVSIYGDKDSDSDLIHSIILEVEAIQSGSGWFKVDMITELNGYNPTLFLGDFTRDGMDDILFRMDKMFNSLNSKDKGAYGAGVETIKDENLETIFTSERYETEFSFFAEYRDLYKVSIMNVKMNLLFFLDISNQGKEYLSQYYHENGELRKPVKGYVLNAEAFNPVLHNQQENSYDLLAIHRIVGDQGNELLGYIENQLSWDGKHFVSVRMMASTPGVDLIP